ncbi:MAG: tRNA lysidine(34) synthetase TilS [Thermoguttaceae bacterium]
MSLFSSLGCETPFGKWLRSGVLLAVSGGADSVAMLRLFEAELKNVRERDGKPDCSLAVAHLNHGLRGEESEQDAVFVRDLAEQFSLPYFEKRLESVDWSTVSNGSFEADAREIRYDFLRKTASGCGLRLIAVAHTKDDQVETVLHRIIRGTGLAGLAGIPAVRPLNEAVAVIRPLLSVSRVEILHYLQELGQNFRTDSSNESTDWTRNRIRHELLPFLRDRFNPNIEEAVLQLASIANDQQCWIDELTEELYEKTVQVQQNSQIVLDLDRLAGHNVVFIRQLLRRVWKQNHFPLQEMGFTKWSLLSTDIVNRSAVKRQYPGDVEVIIDPEQGTVLIARTTTFNLAKT